MEELIELHQTKPGNYLRAIQERLELEEALITTEQYSHKKEQIEDIRELIEEELDEASESLENKNKESKILEVLSNDCLKALKEDQVLKDLLLLDQDDKSSGIGSMHDDSCGDASDSDQSTYTQEDSEEWTQAKASFKVIHKHNIFYQSSSKFCHWAFQANSLSKTVQKVCSWIQIHYLYFHSTSYTLIVRRMHSNDIFKKANW